MLGGGGCKCIVVVGLWVRWKTENDILGFLLNMPSRRLCYIDFAKHEAAVDVSCAKELGCFAETRDLAPDKVEWPKEPFV